MLRLILFLSIAFVVLAPAAEARSCRDGRTVHKDADVRVFFTGDDWYACGPHTRKPVWLYSAEGGYGSFHVHGRFQDKVIFVGSFSGEGGGEYTTVGWFDGRRARRGELASGVSDDVLEVVVAPGGGIGVVSTFDHEYPEIGTRVGYITPGRRELGLATVGGTYVPGSLAFSADGRALSWHDDHARSVPITGERVTCTSGTTLLEHGGARVFEVLPNRRARPGGFQADVLAACLPGDSRPRELAVSELEFQDHWTLRARKPAGARVVFLAGADGIGVFDGPALTFTRPKRVHYVYDVALGASGPPVYAGHSYEDGKYVATLAGQRLATTGGEVERGSLAVSDDGRVTWRTSSGVAQSAPLAGETTLTCSSGTTLLDRDGVRVSEVVGPRMRLLGCAPGITAPVTLLRGGRTSSWEVYELARAHGFVALRTFGTGEQIVTFGPGGVRRGSPDPEAWIRDLALAPDGRVALALRRGRRWRIATFTASGRQRVLARPADGYTARSLAFDGARVTWRNARGAARGVSL